MHPRSLKKSRSIWFFWKRSSTCFWKIQKAKGLPAAVLEITAIPGLEAIMATDPRKGITTQAQAIEVMARPKATGIRAAIQVTPVRRAMLQNSLAPRDD